VPAGGAAGINGSSPTGASMPHFNAVFHLVGVPLASALSSVIELEAFCQRRVPLGESGAIALELSESLVSDVSRRTRADLSGGETLAVNAAREGSGGESEEEKEERKEEGNVVHCC
jgi:hypothetical protein